MKIAKLVALAFAGFAISPARSANRQIIRSGAGQANLSAALKTRRTDA